MSFELGGWNLSIDGQDYPITNVSIPGFDNKIPMPMPKSFTANFTIVDRVPVHGYLNDWATVRNRLRGKNRALRRREACLMRKEGLIR